MGGSLERPAGLVSKSNFVVSALFFFFLIIVLLADHLSVWTFLNVFNDIGVLNGAPSRAGVG